jgi:Fe-S oxidoreductase
LHRGRSMPAIAMHLHCHQKADGGFSGASSHAQDPSLRLLELLGYGVQELDAGCCGMAGTFGYESEHYALSQNIGGLQLFPRIRALSGTPVAATGAACRLQIAQGTGVAAQHPLVFAARAVFGPDYLEQRA